jgi:hypothetical protein
MAAGMERTPIVYELSRVMADIPGFAVAMPRSAARSVAIEDTPFALNRAG